MSSSKMNIDPPLLNSACPWSTTLEDIKALYDSPYTGAVTIRTSLLEGFTHDDSVHQYTFFTPGTTIPSNAPKGEDSKPPSASASAAATQTSSASSSAAGPISTLNTLGYSPFTLSEYLGYINEIVGQRHLGTDTPTKKPFILSVTGTPDEIAMAYALIANAAEMDEDLRLAMEVNLSCPNIKDAPPPAYDPVQLAEYLEAISDSKSTYRGRMATPDSVPKVGVKLPPYTHTAQFEMVVAAMQKAQSSEPGEGCVLDFITCTNTLGSSLLLDSDLNPVLNSESGTGIGGVAGAALHPLALGNVATFHELLNRQPETKGLAIIGVGGVEDKAGFERMRKVGAHAVACASALGRYGVAVFEKITKGD
ncbi:dihydroorotate dehydrogenase [Exophiala xenobiotica]